MSKWRAITKKLASPAAAISEIEAAYHLMRSGNYLKQEGWFCSRKAGFPIDKDEHPIPWYTYPAIAFLGPRTQKWMKIFEFGAGQSTLWWASRVAEVSACEHNRLWYDFVVPRLPSNAHVVYFELEPDGDYAKAVNNGRKFDVIVIDGEDRVNCTRHALKALNETGVIIFDDTQHPANQEAIERLAGEGFKRIDFDGMAPGYAWHSRTTVFYRPENCLAI